MKTHRKALSRYFPKGHIRESDPTYFVEKLWESVGLPDNAMDLADEYMNFMRKDSSEIWPKHHTIRSGNKVKVGDFIQFFVWSEKPYKSKQIVIGNPIEVKKVWDFEIKWYFGLIEYCEILIDGKKQLNLGKIGANDGLSFEDFKSWFGNFEKPFEGQILAWDENIEY